MLAILLGTECVNQKYFMVAVEDIQIASQGVCSC